MSVRERELEDRLAELQEENRQLRKLIGAETFFDPELKLSASQARLLAYIFARSPNLVPKDKIFEALWFDHVDDAPEQKIIDVTLCYMTPKLRRFDIEIGRHWGKGLSIDEANAERLRPFVIQLGPEADLRRRA